MKSSTGQIWLLIRKSLFLQAITYVPLIIFLWMIFEKPITDRPINSGLAMFIAGFTGILRIIAVLKNELYVNKKSRIIGDVVLTLFCWGFALYLYLYGN